MNLKRTLALIPFAITVLSIVPARAGQVEPTPARCWFLRGEQVELSQTCTYESHSWAGGGFRTLTWNDGVKTNITFGQQGRGGNSCKEASVDDVCGSEHFRDPDNLREISKAQREQRLKDSKKVLGCVKVKNNSVCWLR
jgi:hypothetical protein